MPLCRDTRHLTRKVAMQLTNIAWQPICEMFSQRDGCATLALNMTGFAISTASCRGTETSHSKSSHRFVNSAWQPTCETSRPLAIGPST